MLFFNYQDFLNDLKDHENPEKQILHSRWMKYSNGPTLEDESFYQEYIDKFWALDYLKPDDTHAFDSDWELLCQLIASSFSSEYYFDFINGRYCREKITPRLVVRVPNGSETIEKCIDELLPIQIDNLYNIYLEEAISMQLLFFDEMDADEKISFLNEREKRIEDNQHIFEEYLENTHIFKMLLEPNT